MPYPELKALLTDIGVEELGHLEIIGTIVHQLTRSMTPEEIGLVEMTCEAILEGDDPELEEMDDPTRIPPGRGI